MWEDHCHKAVFIPQKLTQMPHNASQYFNKYLFLLPKGMFLLILDREGERENIDVRQKYQLVASYMHFNHGGQTHSLWCVGRCPAS